jgi:hypothetical protein
MLFGRQKQLKQKTFVENLQETLCQVSFNSPAELGKENGINFFLKTKHTGKIGRSTSPFWGALAAILQCTFD